MSLSAPKSVPGMKLKKPRPQHLRWNLKPWCAVWNTEKEEGGYLPEGKVGVNEQGSMGVPFIGGGLPLFLGFDQARPLVAQVALRRRSPQPQRRGRRRRGGDGRARMRRASWRGCVGLHYLRRSVLLDLDRWVERWRRPFRGEILCLLIFFFDNSTKMQIFSSLVIWCNFNFKCIWSWSINLAWCVVTQCNTRGYNPSLIIGQHMIFSNGAIAKPVLFCKPMLKIVHFFGLCKTGSLFQIRRKQHVLFC
jgi:hypothetical protein